ncbi:hypothetical protein F0562_006621 [Nyssa sinensis]|uniref:Uncharacterized protein n=1 Tax=Nyssa sinensis TaxID=561372 RepID=A0A5J5API0_9ASTE|nr:hypothetical protein F0562_006621 [Nyssa sinensis]
MDTGAGGVGVGVDDLSSSSPAAAVSRWNFAVSQRLTRSSETFPMARLSLLGAPTSTGRLFAAFPSSNSGQKVSYNLAYF